MRVHHAKPAKDWLAEHAEAIEVFYLPSYSPELNLDEMANAEHQASGDDAGSGAHEAATGQGHRVPLAQRATTTKADSKVLRA